MNPGNEPSPHEAGFEARSTTEVIMVDISRENRRREREEERGTAATAAVWG